MILRSWRFMAPAMTFAWTLQRYIFKEMGKTFLLTATGLAGIVGLGGGVWNIIELGEVTPGQFLRLMALVLPIAAALTLPIAALFSAAVTYGRLSADNELTACRGSGINIHLLLLPCVVLSLLSATVTFVFVNFFIPGLISNLNDLFSADVAAIIRQRLHRPQGIALGKNRFYADDTEVQLNEANRITLHRVAFVELDGEDWVRYGTAEKVELTFTSNEGSLRLSGRMAGLSYYDRRANGFHEAGEQVIGADDLPPALPRKIKFLTLGELIYYRSQPGAWREVHDAIHRLRVAIARGDVLDQLWGNWRKDKRFVLQDSDARFVLTARSAARVPHDGAIECTDVSIDEHQAGERRTITAPRAVVDVRRGPTLGGSGLHVDLWQARLSRDGTTIHREKHTLGPFPIPADLVARVEALPAAQLLAPTPNRSDDEAIAVRRESARDVWGRTVRRIEGALHERLAFSVSVVVLVILGAALGIVFRGAHTLTAFGISFAPSLIVIIAIVAGKQLSQNAPTHLIGLLVIWVGIALLAAADVWTLARLVRR